MIIFKMKYLYLAFLLAFTSCTNQDLESFARDPLSFFKLILILITVIGLIFLIFIPTSSIMDKFYKKVKWSDGFFGWLIGAIVLFIGMIILTFGTEFIFSLF